MELEERGPESAEILSYEAIPAGKDPMGRFAGGWIKIRGATTRLVNLCHNDSASGERTLLGRIGLDDDKYESLLFHPSTIFLLLEFAAFCNNESRHRNYGVYDASVHCLVLRPIKMVLRRIAASAYIGHSVEDMALNMKTLKW